MKQPTLQILQRGTAVLVAAFALTACQKTVHQESLTSLPKCDVEKVQHYLGQPFEEGMASTLRGEASAEEVRVLGPNSPETRDYRHERLSIRTDEQGLIVSLGCG